MFGLNWLLLAALLTPSYSENVSGSGESAPFSYLNKENETISKTENTLPSGDSAKPIDCADVRLSGQNRNGVYTIWPKNRLLDGRPLDVYCDMATDRGGWTVIQSRGNYGRETHYFYKDWASYKSGFGNLEKDFWLGNDNIFALTNQRLYSVRFDLKAVDGSTAYAVYDTFWIDAETNQYTLHIKDYSGDAGDSMTAHDKMKFSTKDVDNAEEKDYNCAHTFEGAWWYKNCHLSNLNGVYLYGKHDSFGNGVNWKTWKGYYESLESTEIKIRPQKFRKQGL